MKFEKKWNYLVVKNGKKEEFYELDYEDGKPIVKKVLKKQIKDKLRKVKKIVKELKAGVDVEAILEEKLMSNFDDKLLEKLYNLLFKSKRKYKIRTRKHHCVDLKVGRMIIPLVD